MTQTTISLEQEFSRTPFGRYPADGEYNGQTFREELLMPNLREYDKVVVEFGTVLCGSSFLEEVFGGVVRKGYYTSDKLLEKISIKHQLDSYTHEIEKFVEKATFGKDKDIPLKE